MFKGACMVSVFISALIVSRLGQKSNSKSACLIGQYLPYTYVVV